MEVSNLSPRQSLPNWGGALQFIGKELCVAIIIELRLKVIEILISENLVASLKGGFSP